MLLLTLGLRHHNAPLPLRERLTFTPEQRLEALRTLEALPGIHETALLNTCNRTEFYFLVSDVEQATLAFAQWLEKSCAFSWQANRRAFFMYSHSDAVAHLFRVASGLDSLIMGEAQILGQVKEALKASQDAKTNGFYIDRLFKAAISAGKAVRSETGIGQRDASISRAAYDYAKALRPGFLERPVAVIGGGKMASLILERLSQELPLAQRHQVTIVNRSPHRLDDLCQRFGFGGVTWDQLSETLATCDVWFVATGAPHLVIEHDTVAQALEGEHHSSGKLIFDISVPRNVEPEAASLEGVSLFNTDDLARHHNLALQKESTVVEQAELLVERETAVFCHWLDSVPLQKRLATLRHEAELLRQDELSRLSSEAEDVRQAIDAFSRTLFNKWLHTPSVKAKQSARAVPPQLLEEATQLLEHWFSRESAVTAGEASTFKC